MDPLIPQKRLKELGVGGLAFKTLLGARVGCHTAPAVPIFLPHSSFPLPQPTHSENLVSLTRSAWGDQDQTPD